MVRVGGEVGTLEKKRAVDDVTGEKLDMMVMMAALDNGPHREMAVDVPDSFIARNKTPPRYPPPARTNRTPGTQVSRISRISRGKRYTVTVTYYWSVIRDVVECCANVLLRRKTSDF